MRNLIHFTRKIYQGGMATNVAEQGKVEPEFPAKEDTTMGRK